MEGVIGKPLSPYAVTKYVNELYAEVFSTNYDFHTIGLRYFNVFGPRQDPKGAYAAVIPRWIAAMIDNQDVIVNGDGETSRDFCFVDNAVQANLLAACAPLQAKNNVFNVAVGDRTTLNQVFTCIREALSQVGVRSTSCMVYRAFRAGDVRHSQANIDKAKELLGYAPAFKVGAGMAKAANWYVSFFARS